MVSSGGDLRAASLTAVAAVAGAAVGGRADAASGGPDGRSMVLRGATDTQRDGDMRSRRDRPQRPSYWAVVSFCVCASSDSCVGVARGPKVSSVARRLGTG